MSTPTANLPKIKTLMLSGIGQMFAFDEKGEQIAELQKSPIILWAEYATELGYDLSIIRINTPVGTMKMIPPNDNSGQWNFEMTAF